MGSASAPAAPGILSRGSPYSVPETIDRLEATIRDRGLTLFATIDHAGEAERVGLTMQAARLLIFGSPRAGTPLMVASPLLALDLPLKALVWQGAAGVVLVSYTSPEYLADRYAVPPDLIKNIAAITSLIEEALQT